MNVAFFGHSKVEDKTSVNKWLKKRVEELIIYGADNFLLGGYGDFDEMSAAAVVELKKKYPHIRALLILPYPNKKIDCVKYDETIYPPLENTPQRYAISHRNRWMAEQSDVVVAYTIYDWGGASSAVKYAEKKKKIIVRYERE